MQRRTDRHRETKTNKHTARSGLDPAISMFNIHCDTVS